MVVRESSGTSIIGGHIGEFHPGDVFVIGSNVPHVFKNEEVYYDESSELIADVVYVFLDEKLPENNLLNFEEIRQFFQLARHGIRLGKSISHEIRDKIDALLEMTSFERQLAIMNLVYLISKSADVETLNNEINTRQIDENEGKRLNDVMQYTFENYSKRITLEEVSGVAHMVPSAFCRFFKQRTRKTYFDFLNEIRVRNACKLLLNKDFTVLEICFKSGFNNLSYFNRKFKEITGYSPLKYYKEIKGV